MVKEHRGSIEYLEKIKTLEDEISRLKQQSFIQKEIVANSPYYYVLVRDDGQILEFNDSVRKLVQKYDHDFTPKNILDLNFIPPEELNKYLTTIKSVIPQRANKSFESFLFYDDDFIPIKVYISPVSFSEKNIICIYATDISSLKETKESLKESKNYYKTIFEHNGTATLIVEEDSTISLANSQTEQIFGFKPHDIMGKMKWTDFVVPEDQPRMSEYKKLRYANSTSAPNQYEFQIFDRTGTKKDIFVNVCIIPGTKRTLASILDITERNEDIKKIKESEDKYRTLAEAVEDFIYIINHEGKLEYINEYASRKWKLDPSEVVNKPIYELFPPETNELQGKYIQRVFEIKDTVRGENLVTMSPESMWLDTLLIPLKNSDGSVEKVLGVARDMTERKEYELLLSRQNEIHKAMGTILTEAILSETEEELTKTCLNVCEDITQSEFGFICEINQDGKFKSLIFSESLLEQFKVEDIDLNPMLNSLKFHDIWKQLKTAKHPIIYNDLDVDASLLGLDFLTGDHPFLKNIIMAPLLKNNEFVGVIGLSNKEGDYDFSDSKALGSISTTIVEALLRKRAEENLKKALNDIEMLVREIHHRTKNNLMIMASLLNLTSAEMEDEVVKEIFNQTQSRAKSMALIHEKLYQSDNYKQINFGDYIHHMALDLSKSFLKNPEKIQLIMELEELKLDIDTAIPLGLIVNELLTNSMKYAFPVGGYGKIFIKFYKSDPDYVLVVADDGIGLPEDFDINQTDTLGWQLIKNLIGQIDGQITVNTEEGTMATIIFHENKNYIS